MAIAKGLCRKSLKYNTDIILERLKGGLEMNFPNRKIIRIHEIEKEVERIVNGKKVRL